ncbi:MAG: N-acetylmuramoyl-L-alanine amidase [Ruminococcaceae bacterium]|nr:N-acetylmuramoyl-L-alanine amidase [Oscillospiraceae bacterium]
MAIRIYIDQGHNPVNPNAGAEGNGLREQNIVYRIGQETAALLRQSGNYEVLLSRPTPETQLGTSNTTSLRARTEQANNWGADYFISLHTNASELSAATGSEAFVYALGGTAAALAESILNALQAATGLPRRGVFARPSLYVLKRTDMPAILLELGFITNARDARLMNESPELFARGIYEGIVAYTGLG